MDQFSQFVKLSGMDYVGCMADVQSSTASLKRQRKAVVRSLKFLDAILDQSKKLVSVHTISYRRSRRIVLSAQAISSVLSR